MLKSTHISYSGFILLFLLSVPVFAQRDLETITSDEELKQYIYATAPSENAFVALQRLTAPYIDKKDWKGAVKVLVKYREWFPEMFARIQNIIDVLNAPSQNLITTNIESVNTKADEYFPVISVDGSKMYLTEAEGKIALKEKIFSILTLLTPDGSPRRIWDLLSAQRRMTQSIVYLQMVTF